MSKREEYDIFLTHEEGERIVQLIQNLQKRCEELEKRCADLELVAIGEEPPLSWEEDRRQQTAYVNILRRVRP